MSTTHELKEHSSCFESVFTGKRMHEIRVNDRNFKVGDFLKLREWHPPEVTKDGVGVYTGREITVAVTYVTPGGEWNLPDNLCVLSVRRWATDEEIDEWLRYETVSADGKLRIGRAWTFGMPVPLLGHEGHTTRTIQCSSEGGASLIAVECSCHQWFGDNKHKRDESWKKDGCVTPNGRQDCHGKYVSTVAGVWVCSFCKVPVER